MDWTEKMGTKLYVFPKGIKREGLTKTNPAKWTSKYGSVAVGVWDGATTDGMNEAGLVANILYLAETKYGDRDPAREGISVSLWCQYFLDNFATVAEAVKAAESIQFRAFEPLKSSTRARPWTRRFTSRCPMRPAIRPSSRFWMASPSFTMDLSTR